MISKIKIIKGHHSMRQNSVKKVGRVICCCSLHTVVFSAHCCIVLQICIKFIENIHHCFNVKEQTLFSY